ncbi:MAG: sialidase family protein [Gammaproteobacteria bacterium]
MLLPAAWLLSACSQSHPDHLTAGTSDYRNYPEGGGLYINSAFGPDGKLWRVVPEKRHIYVDYSTDLGKTFSAPVRINDESQRIKVSGENRPGIAVDRAGRISVIYAAEGVQPLVIYASVSADNGNKFSRPAPLSDRASEANTYQGRLALNGEGQVYAFWHDERDRVDWQQPGNAIYFTRLDGGSPGNYISHKASDNLCDCCRIAGAFDRNGEPVVFARFIYPGGIRDHGLIKLFNDGRPAQAWRATFDQWRIDACPEHGPALSINDLDHYHIAWFTQGSARQGLFYAHSTDKGAHFSIPMSFGNAERLPSHPDVLALGKRIVLAWTEYDGIVTRLIVMQSTDGGQNWQSSRNLADAAAEADYPILLRHDQDIYVSWNSKKEGYRLIPVD